MRTLPAFVFWMALPARLILGQSAELPSPVDRSQPMETLQYEFGLADGAAANGNTIFVPDVKAGQLLAYRPNNAKDPWQVVVKDQGRFSGTFFQLGQLYVADNPGARILKVIGKKVSEWVKFDDGARPNDLVVDHLGNAYVTLTREGQVRRVAADGSVTVVAEGIETPNGITLSPDGSKLYVSAYKPGTVLQARIDGQVVGPMQPFATLEATEKGALADGMGMDRAGNVYCAGAESVWIWNPGGQLLDKITTLERPINCTLGGQHGMDLYISTFGGLVRQPMKAYGVQPNPAMSGALARPEGRPSTEVPPSLSCQINQVYYQDGSRKLLCDIVKPNPSQVSAGLRPAIVLVHGGGWLHGDKTKFRPLAIRLAQRGYVVMDIEYRLGFEALFPAGIHDCNAAVRFLRRHAESLQIDPNRIAAVGGSAGGHLVGLMATGWEEPKLQPTGRISGASLGPASESSKLCAAVVMAGPMQMVTGGVAERSTSGKTSNATHWLGKTIDEAPQLYQLADAYEKISAEDPPMLFITGSLDNPTRDEPSLQKLKGVGVTASQIIHKGAKHGHWNRADWMPQVVDDIDAFLKGID